MASKSTKSKKVVNQDELRRLMREKKLQGQRQKRVESPYAKYNSLGQLSCALCNVQLKTELLWQAHILGKQHKDKVSGLKGLQQGEGKVPQAPQTSTLKRKSAQPEVEDGKKPKTSGADFIQGKSSSTNGPHAGLGLLAGQYDDDDDDGDDGKGPSDVKPGPSTNELPADFFDSSIPEIPSTTTMAHSGSISKATVEKPVAKKDNMAEALPEGFFDDPVRDAKVRNVDTPKDHMDKEWEDFQKEIQHVSNASEAIVVKEDEEGRLERQFDETNEQLRRLRGVSVWHAIKEERAELKKKKQKEVRHLSGSDGDTKEEEVDEEDEEELMNVLGRDWRAKGVLA